MTSNGTSAGSTEPTGIDTTTAHAARVYDYLLGGQANFEVDREAAERAYAAWPGGIDAVRSDVQSTGRPWAAWCGTSRARPASLMAPLVPGSCLALTHLASDLHSAELSETFNRLNSAMAESVTLRSHDEVAALLGGLDLVEPGVVQATHWRPGPGTAVPESQMWCGVGRKAG